MLIKTPKGVYLRLKDQIVKIRLPNGLMPFGPVPETGSGSTGSAVADGTGSNGSSPAKNSGNGGSVPASPQQKPPDVVDLGSDED